MHRYYGKHPFDGMLPVFPAETFYRQLQPDLIPSFPEVHRCRHTVFIIFIYQGSLRAAIPSRSRPMRRRDELPVQPYPAATLVPGSLPRRGNDMRAGRVIKADPEIAGRIRFTVKRSEERRVGKSGDVS